MKVRIGSKIIEIDAARVQGGSPEPPAGASRAGPGLAPQRRARNSREPVANPAPAPPRYRSPLEADYAQYLELLRRGTEISTWQYEPLMLRLPGGIRYTPDFLIIHYWIERGALFPEVPVIEFHEVKGWSKNRREGITKLKIAAGLIPWASFLLVTRDKTGWHEKRIQAGGGG